MKTIFGFFSASLAGSAALAGATGQSIAAATNSDQTVFLNLRFTILYTFIEILQMNPKPASKHLSFRCHHFRHHNLARHSSDPVSVARIYGSGRRSSSLDCLTSAQTQILAITVCNDLHATGL